MPLYITQVLPIIFPLKWLYAEKASYTKYFVPSYSIDVIYTLSNYSLLIELQINDLLLLSLSFDYHQYVHFL